MLTQKELLNQIFTLPVSAQREIVEQINLHTEQINENGSDEIDEFRRELSVDERVAIALNLSGSLKPDGGYTPMTREEERELIEEYLAEKYA